MGGRGQGRCTLAFWPLLKFCKIYFIVCTIIAVPFSSLLYSPLPCTPLSPCMSMGHTYKFFGFSITHTILNLPLSILYLPYMLFIPCTFSCIFLPPLPTDTPPCDLHFCQSVLVLAVRLVCFCFCRFSC